MTPGPSTVWVFAVVLLLATEISAAQTASPSFAARECAVGLEHGPPAAQPSLRLRPACKLGLDSTRAALAALVASALPHSTPATSVSVFLGRIEEYRWLSMALVESALQSPQWNARRGKMKTDNGLVNAFVAELIEGNADVQSLLDGWRLRGVSIEKVLVGPAEQYLPDSGLRGRLPFDAMCWLRFEKVVFGNDP